VSLLIPFRAVGWSDIGDACAGYEERFSIRGYKHEHVETILILTYALVNVFMYSGVNPGKLCAVCISFRHHARVLMMWLGGILLTIHSDALRRDCIWSDSLHNSVGNLGRFLCCILRH